MLYTISSIQHPSIHPFIHPQSSAPPHTNRLQRELEAGPRHAGKGGRRRPGASPGAPDSDSEGHLDVDEVVRGVRDKTGLRRAGRDAGPEAILTEEQVAVMRAVYARVKGERDPAVSVLTDPALAPLSLSKDQVVRQLKKLGTCVYVWSWFRMDDWEGFLVGWGSVCRTKV